jgi:hypothetical protein
MPRRRSPAFSENRIFDDRHECHHTPLARDLNQRPNRTMRSRRAGQKRKAQAAVSLLHRLLYAGRSKQPTPTREEIEAELTDMRGWNDKLAVRSRS